MKRNMDQKLVDTSGNPFPDGSTLKTVCFGAALGQVNTDQQKTIVQKQEIFALAKRIDAGGIVELTTEEIVMLKDRINFLFPIIVVAQCATMLDTDYTG